MYPPALQKTLNLVFISIILGFLLPSITSAEDKFDGAFWQTVDHFQTTGKVIPLEDDGIHDPANDSAMFALQPPVDAMGEFPRDSAGLTDWVKALKDGHISPRSDISGKAPPLKPIELDILFSDTGAMPNVLFPHKQHTEWLACSNCHPAIFKKKKGSTTIKMDDIFKGEYCGLCHGKIAFAPTKNCMRCHSVQQTKK